MKLLLRAMLFLIVVAAGVAAAALMQQGSLLYAAMPLVMALAVLGLPLRAAAAAGFIAAAAVVAKMIWVAFGLEPLGAREWPSVVGFMLCWGVLLGGIAHLRTYSKLAAAALVLAAAPIFIVVAVPLVRALDTMQRTSVYIPMRDSVRIAVDVYLPRGAVPGTSAGGLRVFSMTPAAKAGVDAKSANAARTSDGASAHSLPTILQQTRYFRRVAMHWPYELLFDRMPADIHRFVDNGYAYVKVDARGSGASFGSRNQEWSDDEIKDGSEVVDWIVAQPWSSGKVGATGVSYDGTTTEMLLANHHPAVKAAAPRFCLLDPYTDIAFPGGIHLTWFTENWGQYNDALDRNALTEQLAGFQRRIIKGIAPVDGHEDLLAQAVADHARNYNVHELALGITYRDDAAHGLSMARMSPFAKPAIAASGVPIYNYSGWYDGAYQRAAISRFLTYKIPGSHLLIGPWDHGARQNISPHNPAGNPIFNYICPACSAFEPLFQEWKARLPKDVHVIYVPADFREDFSFYARVYYAAELLGLVEKTHHAVYKAIHDDHKLPGEGESLDPQRIANFYAQYGTTAQAFVDAMDSFAVNTRMNQGHQFEMQCQLQRTPTLVVGGKYLVKGKTHNDFLRIAGQLIERERNATHRIGSK